MGRTLSEKVWDEHVVRTAEGEPDLLYVDLHLIHEVTSPQAFEGLRLAGAPRSRPCARTPRSSASGCTRSATSSRASCTWSARSSA